MHKPYFVVDAFASAAFTGNPAAVVLDADALDDRSMQLIAAEFNLSETTFVLKPQQNHAGQAAVRFRWFTPASEVSMCGHATVAGVHALLEAGRLRQPDPQESSALRIETMSGTLTASVECVPATDEKMIWLDLPDPTLTPFSLERIDLSAAPGLLEGLDREFPAVKTQDEDLMVFIHDVAALNNLRPNFSRLAQALSQASLRGLFVATVRTITPSVHVQSRFFAPNYGINEDPVTGSVHGPLAAYLVDRGFAPLHDGLAALTCVQGVPGGRTGLLHVLAQPQPAGRCGVRIAGRAVTTMTGTLRLP
jgi:PhzF family phenazine biosynthesis protein